MGRRFRGLFGTLKDKASIGRATLLCFSIADAAPSSPYLAVLRATTHHPPSDPPHPRQIDALLSYGYSSRLSAAACVDALTSRLRSTRDPSVALKSLLAIHHIAARGAFILRDQLAAAAHPGNGRNPLNLSAFRDASSAEAWALSAWVRWLARVLELLLAAARALGGFPDRCRSLKEETLCGERVTSLLNSDLLGEIDALVAVVEEIARAPEAAPECNGLVGEAVRLVEEDRLTAEREILVRLREMGERLGSLRFAESVELVCLLRRLEECRDRPVGGWWSPRSGAWFWSEVRIMMKMANDVVVREEEEEARGRRALVVTRSRSSESARYPNRKHLVSVEPVRFGSNRQIAVYR